MSDNDQKNRLGELLLDDSFVRWIRGESAPEEKVFWETWQRQRPENKELAREAEQMLNTIRFKEVDSSDVEAELQKLNSRLNTFTRYQPSGIDSSRIYRYAAAAAVLILIVSTGLFVLGGQFDFASEDTSEWSVQTKIKERTITQKEMETGENTSGPSAAGLSTGFAEKATLILNDGTEIILNAQSRLEYPAGNSITKNVTVYLKGEAYFEVAERGDGNERRFTVQTEDGSVHVLGTKFSVTTRNEQTEVALKQGVVEVQIKDNDPGNGSYYTMKPGELAQFSKEEASIEVARINPEVYFSWTGEKLLFNDTPLSQIIWRIEQTYGVKVEVKDPSLLEKRMSGSIRNNDLEVLLKALSELLQTPIERNKTSIIMGT